MRPQRLPGTPIEEIRNSIGAYLAALLAAFMAVIVVGSLALGVIRFVPALVGGNVLVAWRSNAAMRRAERLKAQANLID